MKAIIIFALVLVSSYSYAIQDTINDTIVKHSFIEVDGHLVLQDTILIQQIIHEVETQIESGDHESHVIELLVLALVILSIINHYIKNKRKNG